MEENFQLSHITATYLLSWLCNMGRIINKNNIKKQSNCCQNINYFSSGLEWNKEKGCKISYIKILAYLVKMQTSLVGNKINCTTFLPYSCCSCIPSCFARQTEMGVSYLLEALEWNIFWTTIKCITDYWKWS